MPVRLMRAALQQRGLGDHDDLVGLIEVLARTDLGEIPRVVMLQDGNY